METVVSEWGTDTPRERAAISAAPCTAGEIAGASSCLESRSKDEVDGQAGREQTLRGEEEEEGKEEEEREAREQATQRKADERGTGIHEHMQELLP